MDNVERGKVEEIEELTRDAIDKSKQQLEYYYLHQDFSKVKQESIARFLVSQEQRVKDHLNQRAQTLLQTAAQFEKKNEQQLVNGVVQEVFKELESIKETVPYDVYKSSFESAL